MAATAMRAGTVAAAATRVRCELKNARGDQRADRRAARLVGGVTGGLLVTDFPWSL